MTQQQFWGEGGKYGPYTAQEDGWPHAGEVMRDYRLRMAMSAEEAAKLYSAALDKQRCLEKKGTQARPITASWILNMEKENRIPTDITRRRLLADMLHIPYALLGLSPLEQVLFKPNQETLSNTFSPTKPAKSVLEDVAHHEKEVSFLWQLHYTNTAYNLLEDVDIAITRLKYLEQFSKGRLKEHIQILLHNYYLLGDVITNDQRAFALSYSYGSKAIQIAQELHQEPMIANALYSRGHTLLVRGCFGNADATGILTRDTSKIQAAIDDFDQALPYANPQLKGIIKLELSRAYGTIKRSNTDIAIAQRLIEQAEDAVGVGELDTSYIPMGRLNEGMYHVNSAITLTAIGRPEKAIEELDYVERLRDEKGIGRNQTRRYAWIDILYAQAYIDCKEYYEATRRATNALLVCKDIHSTSNIAIIGGIHGQLLKSPYKSHREVKDLGLMLSTYFQVQPEKGV